MVWSYSCYLHPSSPAHHIFRGVVNSFGAYQTYYETALLASSTSSAISWIGTVQAFLLIIVGVVSGPFYDRGYIRTLIVLGTIMTVFGMMMTSLASRYWEIFLAQGLCVGLGLGCLYVPSVAIVSTYFSTKRALAVGLTSAGGSLSMYALLDQLASDVLGEKFDSLLTQAVSSTPLSSAGSSHPLASAGPPASSPSSSSRPNSSVLLSSAQGPSPMNPGPCSNPLRLKKPPSPCSPWGCFSS